jgi:biotin carboxyl carrier protein
MRYFVRLAGQDHSVDVVDDAGGKRILTEQGSRAASISGSDGSYRVLLDGRVVDLTLSGRGDSLQVFALGSVQGVNITSARDRVEGTSASDTKTTRRSVSAQMPGRILHVRVQPGQRVQKGQPLLVMEAMKMENELYADDELQIVSVTVQAGDAVEMGAELLVVES